MAIAIVLPFYNEKVISPNCAERLGFLELVVVGLTPVRHQKDFQNAPWQFLMRTLQWKSGRNAAVAVWAVTFVTPPAQGGSLSAVSSSPGLPCPGFWLSACSPAPQQCQLVPLPPPARAGPCGTARGWCLPAPPESQTALAQMALSPRTLVALPQWHHLCWPHR